MRLSDSARREGQLNRRGHARLPSRLAEGGAVRRHEPSFAQAISDWAARRQSKTKEPNGLAASSRAIGSPLRAHHRVEQLPMLEDFCGPRNVQHPILVGNSRMLRSSCVFITKHGIVSVTLSSASVEIRSSVLRL